MDVTSLTTLTTFRSELYAAFRRRRDALVDLCDTLLSTGSVSSFPTLSLQPQHRRGWGSLYDALADGVIDATAIESLLLAHPLANGEPIYAVDASVWMRCDAETSPGRAIYYHPSRHSAGQPVVAGWAYSWIAQLGFERSSWTAPVSVRRLEPQANPNIAAAEQISALLNKRLPDKRLLPWFVFDAGYDPVQLTQALSERRVAILVRLRSGRCFYADPTTQPATGRPRRHGHKLDTDRPETWPAPSAEMRVDDEQYGQVRVRAWDGFHPKTQGEHAQRDARGRRPIVRGTLLLVEVSRLPQHTREPQALWLWWHAPDDTPLPNLDRAWRAYVRRFDLEHTFRFLKQTLNWTLPRVRHPEQADRWTWLVVAAYTQLRLARALVADQRLPWEHPLLPGRLTPARVRRAFSSFLATLGSPAQVPKPCGRSPGRPKGARSGRAPRYPALTKALKAQRDAA